MSGGKWRWGGCGGDFGESRNVSSEVGATRFAVWIRFIGMEDFDGTYVLL